MQAQQLTKLMERVMPECPAFAPPADRRFSFAQMQAFTFEALSSLLASGVLQQAVTLNGHALKNALALTWPDGESDPDQGFTEVTLRKCTAPFEATCEEGIVHSLPAGLYLSYDDMPDEGIVEVSSEPAPELADQGLAQKAYDAMGNEIFATAIEQLRADPSNIVDVVRPDYIVVQFSDTSKLAFSQGYAHVYPPAST
jgi:hypothetical protein